MKNFNNEDWHLNNKQISISKNDMNQLVLNFFIVEGYREAAINFSKATGIKLSLGEIEKMTDRIETKQNILNGQIDIVLDKFKTNPNTRILFSLKMQKLIEIIKQNQIKEAIDYAQREIIQHLIEEPSLLEETEKVMSLIAFEDMNQSPHNQLLKNSQRIKIASEINAQYLILEGNGMLDAKLTILMKLLQWAQKSLSQHLKYPEIIDIQTGQFGI
ncbi:hypothetical protein pb186bvf_000337 [Paramecium bursaria]